MRSLNLTASDLAPFSVWKDQQYTRVCLNRSDDHELLLICWDQDVATPVHCHDKQDCWVFLVDGTMQERRYEQDEASEELCQTQALDLKAGQVSFMNDSMGFHDLRNTGGSRAMTLHLYMEPIDECNVYSQEEGQFSRKTMVYDEDYSSYVTTVTEG